MSEFKPTGTETTLSFSPIEPLQPQLSREKPQKVINGWQKLLVNAEKINQLSEQLEEALLQLKITASEIKSDQNAHPSSNKIFKHKLIAIPCIQHKRPGLIVVSARKIDLFQQEREALQLAQMLRRRTKKRLKRPLSIELASSKIEYQSPSFFQQVVSIGKKLIIVISRKPTTRNRPTKVNTISC